MGYDAPMVDEANPISYKGVGVDIDAGSEFVKKIGPLVRQTHRPEVLSDLGGFGGLFSLDIKKYRQPVLVSGTDGVGTKLRIASLSNRHDTIGIDLVAMCVNDVAVVGAEPLFFLDYLSTGKLDSLKSVEVVKGIVEGCKEAGCALVGGETAEMPSFYKDGDYDLAGFCVGIVEKDKIIDGQKIQEGDSIIGLASSGLHSNGFSLVRTLLLEQLGMSLKAFVPSLDRNLEDVLLMPTRIYVKTILALVKEYPIHGIAHITGGGLTDNIPRILPEGLSAKIYRDSWDVPAIFNLVQEKGKISESEMFRVLNMGIGLVLVVPNRLVQKVREKALQLGQDAFVLGEITKGSGGVVYA